MAPESDRLVQHGDKCRVEYAVRSDGSMPAREWLLSQDVKVQASFGVLFKRLCGEGRINNEEQFRRLSPHVWEFKRGGHRLFCYWFGCRFLLTHRAKKAGGRGKCRPQDIELAQTIGEEHIELESNSQKKGK